MTDSSSLRPLPSPASGRSFRYVLLMSDAVIRPGSSQWVSARPSSVFRADRIIVSPSSSFPLSLFRRSWTLPLVLLGRLLLSVHRLLAFALRVDLSAPRHRREYVGEGADESSLAGIAGDVDEIMYDEEEDLSYVMVEIPLNFRERILAPLARLSRVLSRIRLSWQYAQLAFVSLTRVTIGGCSQLAHGSPLPCDMLSPTLSIPMSFASCSSGQEIKIHVHNSGRVVCHLAMCILGTATELHQPARGSSGPSPEQLATLARCYKIGLGELQARVVRGNEDERLAELAGAFDSFFALSRSVTGSDFVPIGIRETYDCIVRRQELVSTLVGTPTERTSG